MRRSYKKLSISDRCITAVSIAALLQCLPMKIDYLVMSNLHFSDLDVAYMFVNLVVTWDVPILEITRCVFTSKLIQHIFRALPGMKTKTLIVNHQDVTDFECTFLKDNEVLECVSLASNRITLNSILVLNNIHTLDLSNNDFTETEDWSVLTSVSNLVLDNVRFSDASFECFCVALKASLLHSLALNSNDLGDERVRHLFRNLKSLNRLSLAHNGLTNGILETVASQHSVPAVNLNRNPGIDDLGVSSVHQTLYSNCDIKHLSLLQCSVSSQMLNWVNVCNKDHSSNKTAIMKYMNGLAGTDSIWNIMPQELLFETSCFM